MNSGIRKQNRERTGSARGLAESGLAGSHSPTAGNVSHEYVRLVGQFPRFQADVFPPVGQEQDVKEWAPRREAIANCIKAGDSLFPMPDAKHAVRFQAQLWWWSVCGSILGPIMGCLLEQRRVPVLDWSQWSAFLRDDYWVGFQAHSFVDAEFHNADWMRAYGRQLAQFLEPISEEVSEVGRLRPAPLWAVVSDAVANAALAVGNELMEPWDGCIVACALVEGMKDVHPMPLPSLWNVCDGEVAQWDAESVRDGEEPEFDMTSHLERATCCMIYHCPNVDLCVSCPKNSKQERFAQWVSMSQW